MAHERGKYTSRTKARKRAAEILFEADQRNVITSPAALLRLLEERKAVNAAPSPLPPYATRMVEGVAGSLPEIDGLLKRHTKGTPLDRLPAFDLAVLRGAVWEMLDNSEEVPAVVAIDEAVAVVKPISTDDSPALVNAVLDAVRKELDVSQPQGADDKETGRERPEDNENSELTELTDELADPDLLNEY